MRKLFFAAFILAFIYAIPTWACTCVNLADIPLDKQIKEAVANSARVFNGKVTKVVMPEDDAAYAQVTVYFTVQKTWKGKARKTLLLKTGRGGGDCGYRFEVGKTYLVYAYSNDVFAPNSDRLIGKQLETGICTRTQVLDSGTKDIEVLKQITRKR